MSSTYLILSIVVMAVVTFFTRAFPFLFFIRKKPPALLLYLERMLPPMIMLLLVLYSLKDIKPLAKPYGIPEVSAIILVVLVHRWKSNTFVSIAAGTFLYMVLRNLLGA